MRNFLNPGSRPWLGLIHLAILGSLIFGIIFLDTEVFPFKYFNELGRLAYYILVMSYAWLGIGLIEDIVEKLFDRGPPNDEQGPDAKVDEK